MVLSIEDIKMYGHVDDIILKYITDNVWEILGNVGIKNENKLTTDEQECCICFETKLLVITECNHTVCKECGSKIETCPLCRKSVNLGKYDYDYEDFEQYIFEQDYNGIFIAAEYQVIELLAEHNIKPHQYLQMYQWVKEYYDNELDALDMCSCMNEYIGCVFRENQNAYFEVWKDIIKNGENSDSDDEDENENTEEHS